MKKDFIVRITIFNILLLFSLTLVSVVFAQRGIAPTKPSNPQPTTSPPPGKSIYDKIRQAIINKGKSPAEYVDPAVAKPTVKRTAEGNVIYEYRDIVGVKKLGIEEIEKIPPALYDKLRVKSLSDPDAFALIEKHFKDLPMTIEQGKKLLDFYNTIENDPRLLDAASLKIRQGEKGIITVVFELSDGWLFGFRILSDGTTEPAFIIAGKRSSLLEIPKDLAKAFEKIQKREEEKAKPMIEKELQPVSSAKQLQITRALFERKISRLNEKLKKEGKFIVVTDDVANLDIIVSDSIFIGGNTIRPEEYDSIFGKEEADALRRVRDSYRRRWEEVDKIKPENFLQTKTGLDLYDEFHNRLRFGQDKDGKTVIPNYNEMDKLGYHLIHVDENGRITLTTDVEIKIDFNGKKFVIPLNEPKAITDSEVAYKQRFGEKVGIEIWRAKEKFESGFKNF